jgi:hypothetical protein
MCHHLVSLHLCRTTAAAAIQLHTHTDRTQDRIWCASSHAAAAWRCLPLLMRTVSKHAVNHLLLSKKRKPHEPQTLPTAASTLAHCGNIQQHNNSFIANRCQLWNDSLNLRLAGHASAMITALQCRMVRHHRKHWFGAALCLNKASASRITHTAWR